MISDNKAIFTIGTAAKMLEVHPRTLRIYERENLVKPLRKGQWRYYTMDDIKWIQCLRDMIHEHGISIAAIKSFCSTPPAGTLQTVPLRKESSARRLCPVGLFPERSVWNSGQGMLLPEQWRLLFNKENDNDDHHAVS